jgi:hypothetical protein
VTSGRAQADGQINALGEHVHPESGDRVLGRQAGKSGEVAIRRVERPAVLDRDDVGSGGYPGNVCGCLRYGVWSRTDLLLPNFVAGRKDCRRASCGAGRGQGEWKTENTKQKTENRSLALPIFHFRFSVRMVRTAHPTGRVCEGIV